MPTRDPPTHPPTHPVLVCVCAFVHVCACARVRACVRVCVGFPYETRTYRDGYARRPSIEIATQDEIGSTRASPPAAAVVVRVRRGVATAPRRSWCVHAARVLSVSFVHAARTRSADRERLLSRS